MSDVKAGPRADDVAAIDQLRDLYGQMRREIGKVIIGQETVVEQLLMCILARGHGLLMGVPGLAKTTIVNSLAQVMSLEFNRIQFTPDLMPSDISGTEILEEDETSGHRFVKFVKGRPVGKPIDVLSEFLDAKGQARGRPAGVAVASDGGLLVADDVGNTVWRVSAR